MSSEHRNQNRQKTACAALLVALVTLLTPAALLAESLSEYWQNARSDRFVAPSGEDLKTAERLFRRIFRGERSPVLRQAWKKLGFELTGTRHNDVPVLILREFGKSTSRKNFKGLGFFAFAADRTSSTVLQVPHSFNEPGTGDIAIQLLADGNFRAAAWNTAPAATPTHPQLRPERFSIPPADYITAFTRALLSAFPDPSVVQLHGFDPEEMYTPSAQNSHIIVSGYGKTGNTATGRLGRCLKGRLDNIVRIFPTEVKEMGATINRIGKLMVENNSQGFVHLAMNKGFRQELRSDPEVRQNLFSCLVDDADDE